MLCEIQVPAAWSLCTCPYPGQCFTDFNRKSFPCATVFEIDTCSRQAELGQSPYRLPWSLAPPAPCTALESARIIGSSWPISRAWREECARWTVQRGNGAQRGSDLPGVAPGIGSAAQRCTDSFQGPRLLPPQDIPFPFPSR